MATYITTRDIIIPAGTRLQAPPKRSSRWGRDFEAVVADGADNHAYFSTDKREGLESGLLRAE